MNRYVKLRIYYYALLFFSIFGCALSNRSSTPANGQQASNICSGTGSEDTGGKVNFSQADLRGHLVQYCAKCHASNSLTPAVSFFADDDAATAYSAAVKFIDLGSPANSVFVKRMQSAHNCNSNCQAWGDTFKADIEKWAQEQSKSTVAVSEACIPAGTADIKTEFIVTDSKSISSTDTTWTSKKLIYDLTNATPSIPGATFEVTVQRYMNQSVATNNYFILNPTLSMKAFTDSPTSNIQISLLTALFNGVADPLYEGFLSTVAVILPVTGTQTSNPFSILTQLVEFHNPDGDNISFKFHVEKSSSPITKLTSNPYACKSTTTFNNSVFNVLSSNSGGELKYTNGSNQKRCTDCHGPGQNAFANFPMGGAGVDVCQEFKKRNLSSSGSRPAWDSYVTAAGTAHQGMQYVFATSLATAIANWKAAEQ